ncbi:MAG: S1 RNA-binding domain-containing protein [Clostridia bacterium]|nr:S1 RNA-binding domain-containing protein [Clostridia bacterium]
MDLEVGSIYEGKVTGITKFGAFVQIAAGKSGMVHISEVANTFVSDINEYLKVGQAVKVKLIAIDQQGRINLSIKKAMTAEAPAPKPRASHPAAPTASKPQIKADAENLQHALDQSTLPKGDDSFENKLKAFMQSSESRISDLKSHNDKRSGGRRRK